MQRNSIFKEIPHSKLIKNMRESILRVLSDEESFHSNTKIGLPYEFDFVQLNLIRSRDYQGIELLLSKIKKELALHIHMVPMKEIVNDFVRMACYEYNRDEFLTLLKILSTHQSGLDDPNYQINYEVLVVHIDISSRKQSLSLFQHITGIGNMELTQYFLEKGASLNERMKEELITSHINKIENINKKMRKGEFTTPLDTIQVARSEAFISFLKTMNDSTVSKRPSY